MRKLSKFGEWAIERHRETNHYYDKYLPYEFHLNLVRQQVEEYKDLCDIDLDLAFDGAAGHDLIEDARVNYNQIIQVSGSVDLAELILSVTNMRGRNPSERANAEYYEGVRKTPGARFLKLCDRLANLKYGILTKSSMVRKYAKEYPKFKEELYDQRFDRMFKDMERIFEESSKQ